MKRNLTLVTIVLLFVFQGFSQEGTVHHPTSVSKPVYFDVSPPLRDMIQTVSTHEDMSWKEGIVKNYPDPFRYRHTQEGPSAPDVNLQQSNGPLTPDTTAQNFDGIGGTGFLVPPDTYGDVGPSHYVQVVNCQYAVYNKTGVKIFGPTNTSNLWSGMPNNSNDGDACVNYDEAANRWIITQFSLPNYPSGPFYEMIAVSQTPDPTGAYYRYQFSFASTMPDYPKFGVWPDGYYMSANRFSTAGSYQGIGAYAFNRTKMLAGDAGAEMISFTLTAGNEAYSILPADCDGEFPPVGTPNYFTYVNDNPDHLRIYELLVDWTNTANSTFTQTVTLDVNSFSAMSAGIPQKGTSVKLDAMSPRLMYRLQFRKFSDHWSMVATNTISVSGISCPRWYELRKTGSDPWSIYQQGTFNPDANHRWESSIAMDALGNIALGYSISSSTMYPSIRYVGRLAGDPLNTFGISEAGIYNGTGYQGNGGGNPGRWGDYSSMTVDPSENGKFWFTTEYYASSGGINWKTRVGSFSYANILAVTASATPQVLCTGMSTQLNASATGGSGTYTYFWTSVPSGFTSTQQNPTVTPSATTDYIVAVNDGSETKSSTVTVTVNTEPTAFAGNDATYPNSAPLFPVSGQATSYSTVKWLTAGDGTFNFDTLLNCLYSPGPVDKNTGGVDLTLKANPISPCANTATDDLHITLTFPVGIGDGSNDAFGFRISPNPTTGVFNLELSGIRTAGAQVTITDVTGKPVYQATLPAGKNTARTIDLSAQSRGVYIVKVTSGSEMKTEKLVVK